MRVAFGEYQLDTKTRTLQREGRRISVQSKAFDLLAYLIERRERVVPSNELLDGLWPGLHVTPAALSTAVQKARQAVGDDGEHQAVLQTEHGKGFRFVAEVTNLSAPEAALGTRDGSAVVGAFRVRISRGCPEVIHRRTQAPQRLPGGGGLWDRRLAAGGNGFCCLAGPAPSGVDSYPTGIPRGCGLSAGPDPGLGVRVDARGNQVRYRCRSR